jgi:hypothetical protein
MVLKVFSFLVGALSFAVATAKNVAEVPIIDIASFDFKDLQADATQPQVQSLIEQLSLHGIVTIRNIPGYADARTHFLKVAVSCVNSEKVKSSPSLLYKLLEDGTERFTISTKAQVNHPTIATSQLPCPEYLPALETLNTIVDTVAIKFSQALDATAIDSSSTTTQSLEEIITTGEHLNHFHEYSINPQLLQKTATSSSSTKQLSLNFHTDNGVMIFMVTPEFFKIEQQENQIESITSIQNEQENSGLLIQNPHTSEIMRPFLKANELTIMIGEGFRSWKNFGHSFNPVLHAMKMPSLKSLTNSDVENTTSKIARAWQGKMILLPKDTVMQNNGMTFGEYANKTTQYLLGNDVGHFGQVACPRNLMFVQSDASCTVKKYIIKPGSTASAKDCMKWCNTHEPVKCKANCKYVSQTPGSGLNCWMLCIPKTCPSNKKAICVKGKQEITCV